MVRTRSLKFPIATKAEIRYIRLGQRVPLGPITPSAGKCGVGQEVPVRCPLAEAIASVCRRRRIDCLYAFGSRSQEIALKVREGGVPPRSEAAASDVDIGVLPEKGVTLESDEKVRLMADLEDLLGVGRVDLVVLPEAPADLAFDIIQGTMLFDADPDRSAEYELYVMRRAGDLSPYLRERVRAILTEQAS